MNSILGIFQNEILLCAICSWFLAQSLKIVTHYMLEHEWKWKMFFAPGGMPSSHTAFVVSTAIMTGANVGFDSAAFAITFVLAAIVMYDASGVRRETGNQAQVINRILQDVLIDGKRISDEQLKEVIGHTPVEVFGGVLTGVLVSVFFLIF